MFQAVLHLCWLNLHFPSTATSIAPLIEADREFCWDDRLVPWKGRVVRPILNSPGQSAQTSHREVPVVLYLNCVVAGLVTLILVFFFIFLAEVVAMEMIGFGVVFTSLAAWLALALAIFAAGFLWELRRLTR